MNTQETPTNTQIEALDRYVDERVRQAIEADRASQAEAQAQAQKAKENEPSALDRYIDSLDAKQVKEAADRQRLRDFYGLNDGE